MAGPARTHRVDGEGLSDCSRLEGYYCHNQALLLSAECKQKISVQYLETLDSVFASY